MSNSRTLRVRVSYCVGFESDPAANTPPANQRLEEPSRNYSYICTHRRVHTITLVTITLTILYTPMSLKANTSDRLNKEQEESLTMDSPCHSFAVSLDNPLIPSLRRITKTDGWTVCYSGLAFGDIVPTMQRVNGA